MNQWFQRFATGSVHGKVSDATIQGYLRAASQIEDIWQQIDDRVDALITQGMTPWDACAQMGYALAFVRACRADVVLVQELLQADAEADPTHSGYLPEVTYYQALALCEHIEPYLEEAIKALTNPRYLPPARSFPLQLGPHVTYGNQNQHFPLTYLQGSIAGAQQMREWTAGVLAKYQLALKAAQMPIPQVVSSHIEKMENELRLADFHFRAGVDMVGEISKGQVTAELSRGAEGLLWEAMTGFFDVSQMVADPRLLARPQPPSRSGPAMTAQARIAPTTPTTPIAPPVQKAPTPSLPDVSDLLKQVGTGPIGTSGGTRSNSSDVSNLLNQLGNSSGASQTEHQPDSSDVSNMLKQVGSGSEQTQENPAPSSPDDSQKRKTQKTTPDSEESILDLFSDVYGERKSDQPGI